MDRNCAAQGALKQRTAGQSLQHGTILLPHHGDHGPDVPLHRLPVCPIPLRYIRIEPFGDQQEPVLLLDTEQHCIGGVGEPL